MGPAEWVGRTLLYSEEYTVARVDSVLDGLVEIARSSESAPAQIFASSWLTTVGRSRAGIFTRLETLYQDVAARRDRRVAVQIVSSAPFQQADRRRVLAFLERVLVSERPSESYETPYYASIQALEQMGPDGRVVRCRVLNDCG